MQEGISLEEACARNVVGTPEDYEQLCNLDRSVKQYSQETTFSIKGTDLSFTVQNTYVYVGIGLVLLLAVLGAILVIKSLMAKRNPK